jgi:uncharacterized damage-inducible protein DinB
MTDYLADLFAHMWWGNDQLFAELERNAPDAETMRLFTHIIATEHLWLSRIDGSSPAVAVWPTLSLAECATLARDNRARFEELLARPDDTRAQRVRYRNTAGNTFDNSVREILTHVALHGHYHRAQIAKSMRAAGREPLNTDYIGYARRDQTGQ